MAALQLLLLAAPLVIPLDHAMPLRFGVPWADPEVAHELCVFYADTGAPERCVFIAAGTERPEGAFAPDLGREWVIRARTHKDGRVSEWSEPSVAYTHTHAADIDRDGNVGVGDFVELGRGFGWSKDDAP